MPDKWHRQNHFILFLQCFRQFSSKLPEHIRMVCYNQKSFFALLFPVSCNIPHHLITYFIISFVNYIIFPLICNYFSHYFPVIFFRFRQHPLCFYFFLLSSPFTAICFPSFPHEFHPAAVPRRLSYRGIRDPFLMQCDAHNIRPVPLSPGSEVHPAHGSVPSR